MARLVSVFALKLMPEVNPQNPPGKRREMILYMHRHYGCLCTVDTPTYIH